MANFDSFDLMEVGEHCALRECKRLDYLPFTCEYCKKKFCQNHYDVNHHKCPAFISKDRVIQPCPLCGKLVALTQNETINDQVERHIQSGCHMHIAEKRKKHKCSQSNCKQSSLIPIYCNECHRSFCIRHRHSGDHTCMKAAPTTISVR